jgi:hypothetical protein
MVNTPPPAYKQKEMNIFNRHILSLCVAFAALAAVSRADVIYSDFGPSLTFITYAGADISDATNDYSPSVEFTPTHDYFLTEVDFVASIGSSSDVNQVTISLYNDNGGIPGTLVTPDATQEFDGQMGVLGTSSAILSWDPSTEIDLIANDSYWITLDGPVPGDVSWNFNNQGAAGGLIYEDGEWQTPGDDALGALDILGSPVPEPGTLLTLGAGLSAFFVLRRRRTR